MKLEKPTNRSKHGRSADVLSLTAEAPEDTVFNPERDIHDLDWKIVEILVRENLAEPEIHYNNAASLASRVKWMELMDPERARATVQDQELKGLFDKVVYSTGTQEQKDQGARAIWADLHARGVENPHPFEPSAILECVDQLLASLTDGKNRFPYLDFLVASDIRACLQMYPDQRTVILERLNKGKFLEVMLNTLRGWELKDKWGAVYGLCLAAELCLIDPNYVSEVKAVTKPRWRAVMERFRSTQRIAERFELFDPKQVSGAANKEKLTAIIANEVYPSLFHKFAMAVHILSADEAGIDGEGHIKVVPHKSNQWRSASLPDRSLVV